MNYSIANEISNFMDQDLTLSILYDEISYALEADTSTDNTDSKKSFGRMILDKIEKLIKELYAIIDRTFSKIGSVIKRLIVTDEGFKKEIRTAIKKNKPLEAVKLISYQYDDKFLETEMVNISNVVFKIIRELKTDLSSEKQGNSGPLDMEKGKLYEYVLKQMGCPDDVTDMRLYYEYLKKGYRGNKKEQLFKASSTQTYYNITMDYNKMDQNIKAKNTLMKQQVSVIKTNLANITKNNLSDDSVKKKALRQSSNATILYNMYSTFLVIYTELKTEKILNYRIVLKKLYHF